MAGPIDFRVEARCGQARVGRVVTAHGEFETPMFMPVGTQGAVKALTADQLREVGAKIILGNTYHLFLRPGLEVLGAARGLHGFARWDGPILTDSGGFQIFSLKNMRKLTNEGVEFQSHIDGTRHFFSPERVVEIQRVIGSDITMCLDECPELPGTPASIAAAVERTTRWAERASRAERGQHQALFGIVQGGLDLNLRAEHLRALSALPFDGYALGGLSVGETPEEMYEVCRAIAPNMPQDKPRYLMGVGTPRDLIEAVASGLDMFDCVLPTRNARMGTLMTSQGRLNIKRAEFRQDLQTIDPTWPTIPYSRAYLRHLFTADEITGLTLMTMHNLTYYLSLMERLRAAIRDGTFPEVRRALLRDLGHDPDAPPRALAANGPDGEET
jgi:queuine tRNA-ribosyltransferase